MNYIQSASHGYMDYAPSPKLRQGIQGRFDGRGDESAHQLHMQVWEVIKEAINDLDLNIRSTLTYEYQA